MSCETHTIGKCRWFCGSAVHTVAPFVQSANFPIYPTMCVSHCKDTTNFEIAQMICEKNDNQVHQIPICCLWAGYCQVC